MVVADDDHPVAGLVNTYVDPESAPLSSSVRDPTAIVPPSALTDTEFPNRSPAAPSDAVSLADVDVAAHPAAGLVNT